MLLIAKTVTRKDIPMNYKSEALLRDEYDRHPATLIHKLDPLQGQLLELVLITPTRLSLL